LNDIFEDRDVIELSNTTALSQPLALSLPPQPPQPPQPLQPLAPPQPLQIELPALNSLFLQQYFLNQNIIQHLQQNQLIQNYSEEEPVNKKKRKKKVIEKKERPIEEMQPVKYMEKLFANPKDRQNKHNMFSPSNSVEPSTNIIQENIDLKNKVKELEIIILDLRKKLEDKQSI
jgi:hypothetical protein